MRVVILGKGSMFANLIRGAMLANAEIVGVFRYDRLKYSRLRMFFRDFLKSSTELTLMKKHKIKDLVFKSANSDEFRQFLVKENVELMLVGTWCEKIDKSIYDTPVIGTVNVHPSLLPKYRGPNPYLQTILHGEAKSGVTFHLMDKNFDCGAILEQKEVEILEGETGKELKSKTVLAARLVCAELLDKLSSGIVIPVPQDEKLATYFPNVKPEEMTLDFEKEESTQLLHRIRAFHPWLPVYLQHGKFFFRVNPYQAQIVDSAGMYGEIIAKGENSLTVATKDGKALKMSGLKLYKFPFLTGLLINSIKI